MNISKHAISNNTKLSASVNIISKLNYIQIENSEKFNEFCRGIAEALSDFCGNGLSLPEHERGTAAVINEMSVSYFSNELISLKCDFTVSFNSTLIFHRRYCINYLLSRDILLLPKLVRGIGRCDARSFFLYENEGTLYGVPIANSSCQTPVKLSRKSRLDTLCNGKPRRIKIKLPYCLSTRKL